MSTIFRACRNRFRKRSAKRYGKGTTDFVKCLIADDLKRGEWGNYYGRSGKRYGEEEVVHLFVIADSPKHDEWHFITSMPASVSLVHDAFPEPTTKSVLHLAAGRCMCRLLGMVARSSGDAQSEGELGGHCCTSLPLSGKVAEWSGRWTVLVVIRTGELAEHLEGKEWVEEEVEAVFRLTGACWDRLPFVVSASRDWPPTTRELAESCLLPELLPDSPDIFDEPELSPKGVLAKLQRSAIGDQERRRLVIEAEAMSFDPRQTGELNSILRTFIEEYRDSDDPQNIVAVGSAIRKYVAAMRFDDMPSIAQLLDAGHKAPVPLTLELETCKMVFRKLVANPREGKHDLPELESRLADVVDAYANDRLLPREKYGV